MRRPILLASCLLCVVLVSLFWIGHRPPHARRHALLLEFKAFKSSLGVPQLPYEFIAHRSLDRLFLKRMKEFLKASSQVLHQDNSNSQGQEIPRIIHQIWLYDTPPSSDVEFAMSTVRQKNPSFQYVLWTRDMAKSILQRRFGRHIEYLQDLTSMADYVAASILEEMGGIVVDPWCECLSPIDTALIPQATFVFGVEPPLQHVKGSRRRLFASPAFLAASPQHSIVKEWKEALFQRLTTLSLPFYEEWDTTSSHERMMWISLDSLTDVILSMPRQEMTPGIIPMGPTWWCPINPRHIKRYHRLVAATLRRSLIEKAQDGFHILRPPFSAISEESAFVHLTGGRSGLTSKRVHKLLDLDLQREL